MNTRAALIAHVSLFSAFSGSLVLMQRRFPVVQILLCEDDLRLPYSQVVALQQGRFHKDFHVVQKHAVSAVHIPGKITLRTLVIADLEVLSGHLIVQYLDREVLTPAYDN